MKQKVLARQLKPDRKEMRDYFARWRFRKIILFFNRCISCVAGVEKAKILLTRIYFHRKIDLKNPKKLNEKILWLEYHTDSELRSRLTDKYAVREYVRSRGYEDNLVPMYGMYRSETEIKTADLPQSFVLKATHGCDMTYTCRDQRRINEKYLQKMMKFWLNTNMAYLSLEMHYLPIKPGIICEKYLDTGTEDLIDYKFHCCGGKVRFILVCIQKGRIRYRNVFDVNWEELDVVTGARRFPGRITVPERLQEMIRMAEDLAEGIPFVRVDLYLVGDKIYFGEMTFTPATGVLHHFTEEFLTREGQYCRIR